MHAVSKIKQFQNTIPCSEIKQKKTTFYAVLFSYNYNNVQLF